MTVNRIDKVNSLLEREISQIILRELFFPQNILVTLTHVEATGNLIEAKAYVSVYPEEKFEEAMRILKREVAGIQKEINKKLNMRPIPKIIFVKDTDAGKAGRVQELLNQLKNEEK